MNNDLDKILREHLVELLKGGGAHAKFEDAVKDLPPELRGRRPSGFPHSPWMLSGAFAHWTIGYSRI